MGTTSDLFNFFQFAVNREFGLALNVGAIYVTMANSPII
jgi:hypothetical protein